MDRMWRGIVLRQAAMHRPAENGQHDDQQTDTELPANHTPFGIDPGKWLPMRSLGVVHVRFRDHSMFGCGSADCRQCDFLDILGSGHDQIVLCRSQPLMK